MDPYVHSAKFAEEVEEAFDKALAEIDDTAGGEASDSSVEEGETAPLLLGQIDTLDAIGSPNLIDEIWEDRPPIPVSPFRVHPVTYAGASVSTKLSKVRDAMREKKATMAVFSALDDVAYLFNLRAKGDVATCPVGIGYAVVTVEEAVLYCDGRKVESDEVKKHLEEGGVVVRPYDQVVNDIEEHLADDSGGGKGGRLL